MDGNQAWIAMFRRIPADLHHSLALGLTTGSEIVVQRIDKLEPDFMIIRGRLAGTQDSGRVVLIPYSQLTFVAIQKNLKDDEVEAIFGKGAPVGIADRVLAVPAPSDTPVPESSDQPAPGEPAAEEAESAKRSTSQRSALVAKLRNQLKDPK
ncbi:MAG: hypothetical protein EXS16_11685 [Gemmataceae bacterium]|nr:hypothetical protein [Gemmataceae bacterium]